MKKLKMQTPNITEQNIEQIEKLFPHVMTETRDENDKPKKAIDFDLLKQSLSDVLVDDENERYRLDWPGKKASLLKANTPITKTLRPCREGSVDFDTTENLYIEGDNFEVLKILQESYLGKIKMIYIDPPYNTGKDFIYKDDFKINKEEYEEGIGAVDEDGDKLFKNTDSNGRFHSDWLSMINERLLIARDLLKDDGFIFISIDDNEVHNLRKICDEIFGEENFLGLFIVNSSPSAIDYGHIAKTHDYTIFYAKDIEVATSNHLPDDGKVFKYTDEIGPFNLYPLYNGNVAFNPKTRPNLFYPFYLNLNNKITDDFYEIGLEEKEGWVQVFPVISKKDGIQRVWRWGKPKASKDLNKELAGYKTGNGEYRIVQKTRLTGKVIRSLHLDKEISSRKGTGEVESLFDSKLFSFPKPTELIKRFITVSTKPNDMILDFFSGSGTTAHSIFRLNSEDGGSRKFIMVQLPEKIDDNAVAYNEGYKNISEIGKERIRRAGKKIKTDLITKYELELEELNSDNQLKLLDDESEEKKKEIQNKIQKIKKLDIGFRVYKTDTTNMKDVYYHPDKLGQKDLFDYISNIKEGRTPEDILTQVILDLGLELNLPIEKNEILGNTVFIVQTNALVACFDNNINFKIIDEIADLKPFKVVFKDASFKEDKDRINLEERFKRLSPETVITVI